MATYNQTIGVGSVTPTRLVAAKTPVSYGTIIKALSGNGANLVYVQPASNVTAGTGWELAAGAEMLVSRAEASDASQLYIISGAGTLGVCWRAV